jgi:hypothetical protein
MERNLCHQAPRVGGELFGGRPDCTPLSFLYRRITESTHVEERDKRDWDLIRA